LAIFLLFTFFFEFALFSILFPTRIAKLRKFETKKTCWLWAGGGQGAGVNPTIQTKNFTKSYCFYFYKGKK